MSMSEFCEVRVETADVGTAVWVKAADVNVKTAEKGAVMHLTGNSDVGKVVSRSSDGVESVWQSLGERDNCDLELRCVDGNLFAHQAVVGAASKMVRGLLASQSLLEAGVWPVGGGAWPTVSDRRKEELVTVILPDVSCGIAEKLLNLLYKGNIPIANTAEAARVKEAWKVLQIDIVALQELDFEKVDNPIKVKKEVVSPDVKMMKVKKEATPGIRRHTGRQVKAPVYVDTNGHDDDPDDPDDVPYFPDSDEEEGVTISENISSGRKSRTTAQKRKPGPASRTRMETTTDLVTKKVKIEKGNQKYNVEQIHNCVICNGKFPDGKVDKEAINLSFRQIKKLKEHYAKCLYAEGKLRKWVEPESGNTDATGKVKDEFGVSYKYTCSVKGCWKAKKKAEVGYKEIALHNCAEHGVLELILEEETRPKLISLLEKIKLAKQQEIEETKPLYCKIRGCQEEDIPFKNTDDYRTLKNHYAIQHYRAWFRAKDGSGEPRTQRATEPRRGTTCQLCENKVFGDDDSMVEHYAYSHDRLVKAVLAGGHSVSLTRKVLKDLFPAELKRFEKEHPPKK